MGTEVSAAEQTAEVVIEEIKETENVVKGAEESSSQFKDLEGKEVEEKVKEDLGIAETSSTESEEKPENKKGDAVVKDVKKEEGLKASNSETLASATDGKGESIEQESDTRAVEPAIEVHEKELKDQIDVANIPEPPTEEIEKSTEDSQEPSAKVSESEEAKEPAISAVSEEENSKESGVAEDPATSAVSEEEIPKESEAAAEEPAISAAVSEEEKLPEVENPTEETTVVFSVSETDDKSEPTVALKDTEPNTNPITTPDASETAETSQVETISTEENEARPEPSKEEPQLTDLCNEEISDKLPEVAVSENSDLVPAEALPLNELTEVGDRTLTSQEVSDVSEKKDTDQHSSGFVEEPLKEENVSAVTDSSPVTEIVEGLHEVEEDMQEKIAVVGEPTLSGVTQTGVATEVSQVTSEGSGGVEKVSEKMDETPGPVAETAESLDAATEVSQVEGEKASGGVEVVEGKNNSVEVDSTTLVQTSRDLDVEEGNDKGATIDLEDSEEKKEETEKAADHGGDNTKEVTAKTPQRQSNSIFSKVKHSIVKVKKAIIGKSPNSKSTIPEGNDDIKV